LLNEQYAKFEKESILKYEESQLEEKYPEYKALLKEYHDGIILYEIMSDEVWTKATKDTSGLREFFTLHKGDYMWPERIDATIYESNDIKKAKLAYRMLGKKKNTSKEILGKINADSPLNISVRVNKFVANDIAYLSGREFKKGRNKPYSFEDKYYVVHVSEKLPVMPKDLSETRGVVTSDYQEYLEKTWLESLEENHSIKINYDVLYNLNK
jgi:peptidyl-prolyl cis-trans isomerase SurA